jgi:hypothetical protein
MSKLLNLFRKKVIPEEKVIPAVKEDLKTQLFREQKDLEGIKAEEEPARYIAKRLRINELKKKIENEQV